MSALDWGVLAGGAAAIGWVNWYFFLAGARPTAADASRDTAPNAASNAAPDASDTARSPS